MVGLINNIVTDLVKEWNKLIEKEKERKMKKLTQYEFISKSKEIHGNRFNYSKVEFKNVRSKIIIICPDHGEFLIRASNHTHMKQGCDACAREKHKLTELIPERLENLKKTHNNKYKYQDLSVNKGFIKIICPSHGEFNQYLYFHEYGHGCPECNSTSRGENKIKSILENKNIKFKRNYEFKDCKRIKRLRFDFYLLELNLCIEYDGEHHFIENKYFGKGNLEYMMENDRIKNEYCESRNIKLIRIPYYNFDKIDNILSIFLKNNR
jgi:very-short-patch-repair endonuclease